MNYRAAFRFWVILLLSVFWGKQSSAEPSFDLANCDFTNIGNSMVETKIANGFDEPLTLHIPEDYFGLHGEGDFIKVRQQLRLSFDPKTLLPVQKTKRDDQSFKAFIEDFKSQGSITIDGIAHSGKNLQPMSELIKQFVEQPGKITQLIPEETGLHRLEGDTLGRSFDIYLDMDNGEINSIVVCERNADPAGIEICFSYLTSDKYERVVFAIPSQEMPRWREIKDGTEQLLACFERG